MSMWRIQLSGVLMALLQLHVQLQLSHGATCNRRPVGASGDPSRVDESFKILMNGNPQTYVPGQRYLVSLSCASTLSFTGFTLAVENENAANEDFDVLGHFEITDVTETRFSRSCENMIESTNTNKKVRIEVAWIAPTNPDSGCIVMKAAVVQHRNVWFIDDGFLTKQLCPEEIDEINSQTPILKTCCACDEAKYEIILERKWNRNTHPKDFPSEAWRTRFSEIIGASHAYDYRFWDYGNPASPGLRTMAEHGSTHALEQEIKENMQSEENGGIRTVIKAPGVPYRTNSMGSTMAAVRVDRMHHLISFVSKIFPSPDWIIGVAGMELCLANCTWTDSKMLNLYPWDVGTDAGPSYMSPDQPQIPDVIRRITSTFPSDHRSPFFDESTPMKPVATLHLTRKKIYEKLCEEGEDASMECGTHPWNDWSECNVKCGPGMQARVRSYKDPKLAKRFNCDIALSQTQKCFGQQCGDSNDAEDEDGNGNGDDDNRNNDDDEGAAPECELTNWTKWSPCSQTCGKGWSVQSRAYVNPLAREKCQSGVRRELINRKTCFGNQCGGSISGDEDSETEKTFSRRPEQNDNYKPDRVRGRYNVGKQVNQQRNEDDEQENVADKYNTKKNDDEIGSERDTKPQWPARRPVEDTDNPDQESHSERDESQTEFGSNTHLNRGGHKLNSNKVRPSSNRANENDNNDTDNAFCFEFPIVQPCYLKAKEKNISNYWFYDFNDQECKIFTTDNCDRNQNKFRTLDDCESKCLIPLQNDE